MASPVGRAGPQHGASNPLTLTLSPSPSHLSRSRWHPEWARRGRSAEPHGWSCPSPQPTCWTETWRPSPTRSVSCSTSWMAPGLRCVCVCVCLILNTKRNADLLGSSTGDVTAAERQRRGFAPSSARRQSRPGAERPRNVSGASRSYSRDITR